MIVKKFEKLLRAKQRDNFRYPRYGGCSFYNIVPTIFALFGENFGKPTLPQEVYRDYTKKNNKVVFFLIDGFGYDQFLRFSPQLPFLSNFAKKGKVFPITAVFPSTTSAALTTIHSGLTPQEHGLIEWYLYFEEIDEIIQTLPFSPLGRMQPPEAILRRGVDPEILFSGKTIYQQFKEKGITPYLFMGEKYVLSSYSRLVSSGAEIITWRYFSDLAAKLRELISQEKSPFCVGVYFDFLDHAEHEFGKFSKEHLVQAKNLFEMLQKEFIEKIKKPLAKDLILILAADHGQINIDPTTTTYLNRYKKLTDNLALSRNKKKILPWGSPRDVFLKIKEEKIEEVFAFLQEEFKDKARVIKSQEAFKQGLFGLGSPHKQFFSRVGDILIIPRGNQTIWYEHVSGERVEFKGVHGGLSGEEMLVPFGIARVKDLQR